MPSVQPQDIQPFARIKVIGVGGSGSNATNYMINSKVNGVEFVVMNTDTQDLHGSKADKKIHIGKNLTKGLGSGMNPEIGKQSAEETKAEIQEALKGSDMVFIACGMGGGTGSGAAPVVARLAKEQGILTIGVVTRPFFFEGHQRGEIAKKGIEQLEKEVDALIVIPNDRLLAITDEETSFKDAFAMCDAILLQAVKGISDLITIQGKINIDYADIHAILHEAGNAFMGIGIGTGQNRATDAALEAINSPLLDIGVGGARRVLFAIAGGDDLKMQEVHTAAKIITESIDPEAKVIFGAIEDNQLKKGEVKVTVIATGFNGAPPRKDDLDQFQQKQQEPAQKPTSNAIPQPRKQSVFEEKANIKQQTPTQEDIEEIDLDDEEPEWSSVPAFLRRGDKKK